ncbi:MAG TPA: T9SS type A sorting domain-containing protein [Ignavibacteria bacterium]|nr:T9SS type A sorting domain-containing protein [Ignavibacteria bacterium]HRJ99938.1 T9SS type A sorting domain-containing protein [Ignavibacteria bacterium]
MIEHLVNPVCGTEGATSQFCSPALFNTFFPMSDDTLKTLVIFANFPDGNWDPVSLNSNLIYMQYWPGSAGQQMPAWADSVICPTTANLWHPSITGNFVQSSNGKFWIIGDVYPDLVILDHNHDYYSPANGRRIGTAVKEIIDKVNPNVNFADYDKFDPCDIDNDDNRREPDGTVDFIFIIFRFTISVITDPSCYPCTDPTGYSGVAALGGQITKKFGVDTDSSTIIRDSTKISAAFPGSGCISEMYFKWNINIPVHEFGRHYGYGSGHQDGLGNHSINGGGIASAYDREHFVWNFGNNYQPTSNTTGINLRDYVTTGDYIKIQRNGKTYYVENRRRVNYYSSPEIHGWKWTNNEPLLPYQRDSGLFIYEASSYSYLIHHAYGKWNYDNCGGNPIRYKITKAPYAIQYIPETVNRYTGSTVMDLRGRSIYDLNCNSVYNTYFTPTRLIDKASYIGVDGDSNTCFDISYNQVFSPWSNPGILISGASDSLAIELVQRNGDGSIDVNVYFTNLIQTAPSKPQYLKTSKQYNTSPTGSFYVRLNWIRNGEPDMSTYGIYKAATNIPGEDAVYSYIASTSDTTFLDQSILMYDPNTRYSGTCPTQHITFSYRISAVDLTEKESCLSERDSISGYYDPCTVDPEGPDNLINENNSFKNELSQNYPNPFNPLTRIKYSILNEGNVKIKLYDISGRIIAVLVNEFKLPGSYYINFNVDSHNLSSGIYFYKIEAFEFSEVRRMIIIK